MDRLRLDVRQRLFVAGRTGEMPAVAAAEAVGTTAGTTRLESVDRELSVLLRSASKARRRAAAAAVAVLVVPVTRLTGDIVEAGLAAVRERRADPNVAASLAALSSRLDEDAFALRERCDDALAGTSVGTSDDEPGDYFRTLVGDESGEAPSLEVAYAVAFARARAASALSWALAFDSEEAAQEAVYETYAAVGNIAALRHLVEHAMSVPAWR